MTDRHTFFSPLLDRLGGYVDGAWILATDTVSKGKQRPTFRVTDPATGALLAELPELGAGETTAGVEAARRAMTTTPPIARRRAWLEKIVSLLEANADELARIVTAENGKPLAEARGEVMYAAGFYAQAAADIEHLQPHVVDGQPRGSQGQHRGHTWTVYHRPAGVAALITPWNFPLAMLAKKLAGAIAGGCAVVVKPAEITPLSCIAFFRLLEQVDLPKGFVNLVFGDVVPIGEVLCTHPAVRVLSFTGSTPVGRLLAAQCAPHLKRLSLELGGNAPFLVFEDADLDDAVERLLANKFRAAGQTCVCTNRVLVHTSVADAFATKLGARVSKLVAGPGTEKGVDLGPLIDGRGWDKVRAHLQDALDLGAKIVSGEVPEARPTEAEGWFFRPVVLRDVPAEARCMNEETFGPLVPIRTFETEAEALEIANGVEAGLAAYVFTKDPARGARVVAGLRYGHVGLNTATGPTPEAPFGGMGASGYGREGGVEGLMEYTEAQTVPTP